MLLCALAIMAYPSLTFSYGNWDAWIYRGLIFLVVACPCGLILSISLAFLGGIASAARQGIVVKGRNHLEDLAKADTFIFDKTGTLTEGVFRVKDAGVPYDPRRASGNCGACGELFQPSHRPVIAFGVPQAGR